MGRSFRSLSWLLINEVHCSSKRSLHFNKCNGVSSSVCPNISELEMKKHEIPLKSAERFSVYSTKDYYRVTMQQLYALFFLSADGKIMSPKGGVCILIHVIA